MIDGPTIECNDSVMLWCMYILRYDILYLDNAHNFDQLMNDSV